MTKAAIHLPEEDDPPQPAKKQVRRTQGQESQLPPSAGRVGGAGARAERPSEGSRKQPDLPQVGRGAKAPSAAAGKRGNDAQKGGGNGKQSSSEDDLPTAARDSSA
jgi:hypothetical protein